MQHQQAAEDHLVEQYLLNEMTEPAREEFEEHFFDCQECALELKATAAFLDATRLELKKPAAARVQPVQVIRSEPRRSWFQIFTPTFAFGALAACLLLIVYQNVIVYPKLKNEIAALEAPEITPTLSLVGASSRGGPAAVASLAGASSLILLVDIPTQPRFASYSCQLYSPTHEVVWIVPVSPAQAKDTVSIRIPGLKKIDGQYSLVVKGIEASGSNADVAQYSFLVNAGSKSSSL